MKVFDYQKVKDPRYFRYGRLDAHSDHPYYASAQEAEAWRKFIYGKSERPLEIPLCPELRFCHTGI